jgi:hypothetical protein
MSGIYYALSIVAIFVVIRWFIANDKIGPDEPTKGLLAMRDAGQLEPSDEKKSPHTRRPHGREINRTH